MIIRSISARIAMYVIDFLLTHDISLMIGPIMIRMGPILEEQLQGERNYSLFKVIP